MNTWQPEAYIRHAAFVPALGAGVVDLLDAKPGERILDLGCGEGTLTETIRARGAQVVGVDSSDTQVKAARTRGLDARVMDGEALSFDREFDAVFSNAALHWMRRPDDVIAGVVRALRPGGRFVAEMGGHGCVGAIHVAIRAVMAKNGLSTNSPWYFPTVDQYGDKLEAHGFAVEDIVLFPRPTPLPTGIEGWLDTFAGPFLQGLAPDTRQDIVSQIAELLRPALSDEAGNWTADYVRLRFRARLT